MIKTLLQFVASTLVLVTSSSLSGQAGSYKFDQHNMQLQYEFNGKVNTIKINERDEGNSSYFYDFFNGAPALVHDNQSLNSYASYSTITYSDNSFVNECIYVKFKSGVNGIVGNRAICGLEKEIKKESNEIESSNDLITGNIIQESNSVDPHYLIDGVTHYLPIIIYRNNSVYVYQLYKSKQDLLNGESSIVSCDTIAKMCQEYSGDTWIVTNVKGGVTFQNSYSNNGVNTLQTAKPLGTFIAGDKYQPFKVITGKTYIYDSEFKTKSSYLIKDDMINVLSIDEEKKWCGISYISKKGSAINGYFPCEKILLN
ncbi:hypothetical protein [Pantoea endophytica]